MYIYFVKFIHLIFTLSLVGSTVYCFALNCLNSTSPTARITHINKIMLFQITFTVITGTLLIYPKHFSFQTPWIQAAYIFVFIFSLSIFLLILFRNKIQTKWLWIPAYFSLFLILVGIIHDAVTKTTFLF